MGPVAQLVFKTSAVVQPTARSVRLRCRSVGSSKCRSSPFGGRRTRPPPEIHRGRGHRHRPGEVAMFGSTVVKALAATALAAGLALGVASGSATARTSGSLKAYFVVGQQLRATPATGTRANDAIRRLLAGPAAVDVPHRSGPFRPRRARRPAA